MVRVIDSRIESRTVSDYFPVIQIVVVGLILGLLFWGLNAIIGRFTNSLAVSGDIATILVATIGLIVMVTMRMARPIIIVLACAATLWGLASVTSSFSLGEMIAWDVILYALAYALFSWISRYSKVVPVLLFIIAIIVIARIVTVI